MIHQLNTEQWEKVYKLFEEAETLNPNEREAFLKRECVDDEDAFESVMQLFDNDDEADSILGESVSGFAPLLFGDFENHLEGSHLIGKSIGVYQIKTLLGRGGMGSVWLAERTDAFEQQVALKIVRRGMDTEDILRRFRLERQILASLNHPNIAKVYAGGMTDDDLPYFIMEYVDGISILDYCNTNKLGITERLSLFQTVCQAVQFAHQNLIVHRDLKPSNILVTKYGEVKLMDFGIAKTLKSETSSLSISMTRTNLRVMTPEYASPEQVKGETITTASDVYQLGILLYELLCGHRPYQFANATQTEIEKTILETDPQRPSIAFRQETTQKEGIKRTEELTCKERNTKPSQLNRQLRGELDTIVLMALRKEPTRRYRSVEQFSEDLRRHQEGLPVLAESDTLSYRFRKFVLRHRVGVGMTSIFMAILALTGGLYTLEVEHQRDRAQQLATSLSGFFDTMSFEGVQGGKLTVAQLLERNKTRLLAELDDVPEVKAQLLHVIGTAYSNMTLPDQAIPLLTEALSLKTRLYGTLHPEVATTMVELSSAYAAREKYVEAEELARKALSIRQDLLPAGDNKIADAMTNLGAILSERQDQNESLKLFNDALHLYTKSSQNPNYFGIASVKQNIGFMYYYHDRFKVALPYLIEALPVFRRQLGNLHPKTVALIATLGRAQAGVGHFKEAAALQEEALQLRKTMYGDEHIKVATTMSNLATFYYTIGKYAHADSLYRLSVSIQRKLNIPPIADLGDWAWTRYQLNDFQQAEAFYKEASDLCMAKEGIENTRCAFLLGRYGYLESKIGKPKEGEAKILQSLEVLRKTLSPEKVYVQRTVEALGLCYVMQGRFAEAEPLLTSTYTALKSPNGDYGRGSVERIKDLVLLYERWKKPAQAAYYHSMLPATFRD
jgi:serine/threonine-protein kinase